MPLDDQMKLRRAPMSIRERGMKGVLPVIVTDFVLRNAHGRYTSVRLDMSKHHLLWMRITLESDVTRVIECVTILPVYLLCCGSECSEFGQV